MSKLHRKKIRARLNHPDPAAQKLYKDLCADVYKKRPYKMSDLGENMTVLEENICGWLKPQYLINHNTKCAYRFMDSGGRLLRVGDMDILWTSLVDVPGDYIFRVLKRNAMLPTFIFRFVNGVAEVQWQLNPDGRYFMDEDGFGMTNDREFNIYGFIDTKCRVVIPFQPIENAQQRAELRKKAEAIVGGFKDSK